VFVAVVAVRIVAHPAPLRLVLAACACSALPDADSFLGLRYEHGFGHRGFFHSLAFAALAAAAAAAWVRADRPYRTWLLLFVVGASHGVLDAMTDGGLGIAFFAPFTDARVFLPWRPLVCPPIEIAPFFSEWGIRVIKSELIWVWLPLLGLLLVVRTVQGGAARVR
jgi:inner membrane protein